MSRINTIFLTIFLLASGLVYAEENGASISPDASFYIGGNIGVSTSQDLVNNTVDIMNAYGTGGTVEGNRVAFVGGFFVGGDINKHFGIRSEWNHLGKYKADVSIPMASFNGRVTESWSALQASVLLKAPLETSSNNNRNVYLKLGFARTQANYESSGDFGTSKGKERTVDTFVPGIGTDYSTSKHWKSIVELEYYPKLAGSESNLEFSMVTLKLGFAYHPALN